MSRVENSCVTDEMQTEMAPCRKANGKALSMSAMEAKALPERRATWETEAPSGSRVIRAPKGIRAIREILETKGPPEIPERKGKLDLPVLQAKQEQMVSRR